MSGAYAHRQLGPSAASGAGQNSASNSRLNDLLDFVRQEFEVVGGEAQNVKLQNIEYENHAHGQIKEMNALRHNFLELQRELDVTKGEYETEIIRLRRELELSILHSNRGSVSLPPAQGLASSTNNNASGNGTPAGSASDGRPHHHQLQSLYNLLPGVHAPASSSSAQTYPAGPSAGAPSSAAPQGGPLPPISHRPPSQPQQQAPQGHAMTPNPLNAHPAGASGENANGSTLQHPAETPASAHQQQQPSAFWRREEFESRLDHPQKKLRMDELPPRPASGPNTPYEHPGSSHGGRPPTLSLPPHSMQGRATPARPSPHLQDQPVPSNATSAPPAPTSEATAAIVPPVQSDASQQQQPSTALTPSGLPVQQQQKPAPEWLVMQNPKVKRTLDIDLCHTLVHDSVVCCVKFSPDARLLATGCNRYTTLYDTQTGQKECTLVDPAAGPQDDNYIRSACFSPDGQLVATGSEDRKIRVWDVASRSIRHVFEGHKNEIYSLAFSPDGRLLFSGSGDSSVRIWEMENNSCKTVLSIDDQLIGDNGQPVDAGVTSVALSPDGRILAAGSLDNHIRIWDASTGSRLDKLRGHKDSVYSVVFAPDASWLVSGSLDKTLKIWDLGSIHNALNNKQQESSNGGGSANNSPVKEEESQALIPSTSEIKTNCITTLQGHKDYVLSVAVPPDGNWIVSGSKDRGVSFWDPKATLANVVLQGHKNSVISIAVSDVGGLLATGSGDWSCRIWKYGPAEQATQTPTSQPD